MATGTGTFSLTAYLHALLDRAYDALDPAPDIKFVAPGATVAWDNMCGQVWVRIAGYQPPTGSRPTRKADGSLCVVRRQANIEVGILRCVAVIDDQGRPPTAKELNADSEQTLRDAEALWEMISCEVKVREILRWTPLGPQGGMAGGHWQFTVDLED